MAANQERTDVIELTKEQWGELVMGQMASRLGLTPSEYFAKLDAGELDPHPARPDIKMLIALGGENARQELLELEASKAEEGN